jgi:hypothetical protein
VQCCLLACGLEAGAPSPAGQRSTVWCAAAQQLLAPGTCGRWQHCVLFTVSGPQCLAGLASGTTKPRTYVHHALQAVLSLSVFVMLLTAGLCDMETTWPWVAANAPQEVEPEAYALQLAAGCVASGMPLQCQARHVVRCNICSLGNDFIQRCYVPVV